MITAKEARELSLARDEKYKQKELRIIERMLDKWIKSGTGSCITVPVKKVPHLSYTDINKHFSPFGYSVTTILNYVGVNCYQITW